MEDKKPTAPKVFISYSWSSPDHIELVLQICTRLVNDGVDVILDKWLLKEGDDKYVFMESMVTNPDVKNVLILSDSSYASKADERKGGVGTESQIISEEIYGKVSQNKFIPIVLEINGDKPCLPVFLKNRIYVDFSSSQRQQENYEQLLRIIFDRPRFVKPQIGKPPSHLFIESSSYISHAPRLASLREALQQDLTSYLPLAKEFLTNYLNDLEAYRISPSREDSDWDQILLSSIKDLKNARDELLDFFELVFSFKEDPALIESMTDFLEKLLLYRFPLDSQQSYSDGWFENYAFFAHEVFIYLIGFLIRHKRFEAANTLMSHAYFMSPSQRRRAQVCTFPEFYSFSRILEAKNDKLNPKRLSPTADLFFERATDKRVTFVDFMQVDFILFLRSNLNNIDHHGWYPVSLVFSSRSQGFELFIRAQTDDGFNRLKLLLNVTSRADLKERYEGIKGELKKRYGMLTFHSWVSFDDLLNIEAITKE